MGGAWTQDPFCSFKVGWETSPRKEKRETEKKSLCLNLGVALPTLSQLRSFKIRGTKFLNYIKFADLLIGRALRFAKGTVGRLEESKYVRSLTRQNRNLPSSSFLYFSLSTVRMTFWREEEKARSCREQYNTSIKCVEERRRHFSRMYG